MSQTEPAFPAHVGIILDGNRRWAKERGLLPIEGHRNGIEPLRRAALHAAGRGVKYLSVWVFSTDNWSRPPAEVSGLMRLIGWTFRHYLKELHEEGVKILFVGRREGLSKAVLNTMERAEAKTKDNTRLTFVICLNYGGHDEIVDAVQGLVASGIKPENVTRETVAAAMYEPEIPGVDLIIRTSGEQRTSGFMLYRSDYAELYFSDKYWPDFSPEDLDIALDDYASRKRRFGK